MRDLGQGGTFERPGFLEGLLSKSEWRASCCHTTSCSCCTDSLISLFSGLISQVTGSAFRNMRIGIIAACHYQENITVMISRNCLQDSRHLPSSWHHFQDKESAKNPILNMPQISLKNIATLEILFAEYTLHQALFCDFALM